MCDKHIFVPRTVASSRYIHASKRTAHQQSTEFVCKNCNASAKKVLMGAVA